MTADIKELVGLLMRVLDGADTSRAEVEDLAFDAAEPMQSALNEAFLRLLEFAYQCEQRPREPSTEKSMRGRLRASLDTIIRIADAPDRLPATRHTSPPQ